MFHVLFHLILHYPNIKLYYNTTITIIPIIGTPSVVPNVNQDGICMLESLEHGRRSCQSSQQRGAMGDCGWTAGRCASYISQPWTPLLHTNPRWIVSQYCSSYCSFHFLFHYPHITPTLLQGVPAMLFLFENVVSVFSLKSACPGRPTPAWFKSIAGRLWCRNICMPWSQTIFTARFRVWGSAHVPTVWIESPAIFYAVSKYDRRKPFFNGSFSKLPL